jgi:hypothetical protein
MDSNYGPTRPPPLWPYLVVCAGVAWVVNLGVFHQGHGGDTVIPVLVSLQRWTPFFWEQDRIGMLVPLLASPLRHPLLNLLTQDALYIFAALAAMFLLAQYMLRDSRYPLAGTLSAVACLALSPYAWFFVFTVDTFYGVWFALGLGALVLTEVRPGMSRPWWRWLVALGLMVLAHWVYSPTALILGPLVVARFLLCRQEIDWPAPGYGTSPVQHAAWSYWTRIRRMLSAEVTSQLLLLAVGFGFGILFLRLATPPSHTDLSSLPISEWPGTWRRLLIVGWGCLAPHHWPYFLFGTAAAGLFSLGVAGRRRQVAGTWRPALALGVAAVVYFLFMGTRRWVVLNSCDGRYMYPSFFLLQGVLALVAVGPLALPPQGWMSRRPCTLAAIGLLLAALSSFHLPSLARVHCALDQKLGAYTADILAARCTHLAGDYDKVWSGVFHANLALHERGESRKVWGITYRGNPTRRRWEAVPMEVIRVAVPIDDKPNADFWLQGFHFPPMVVVEKRSTIYVLRPAAVVTREQQDNLDFGHADQLTPPR